MRSLNATDASVKRGTAFCTSREAVPTAKEEAVIYPARLPFQPNAPTISVSQWHLSQLDRRLPRTKANYSPRLNGKTSPD